MAERPRQTLTDYVAIALSPALIMALVGSLLFFLVEVAYAGAYGPEMRWLLFFFVFGIVLIARIALIGEIANRSGLYALVLGLLVWLGLMKYVTYPPDSPVGGLRGLLNCGLIVLAWWCVNRLVRDCTQIDDRTEIDSRGLLQAAGLEELDVHSEDRRKQGERQVPVRNRRQATADEEPPLDWWQRWQRYRAERLKRRTPGVTVVWFSLAALPLFGLGQSLIPADATDRRRYVFWLLTVYIGSGLGLLLTTSFLGLRRYLNQRKLRMPPAMTAVWLALGGGLIGGLLLLGALLPRPLAEYPLFDFKPVGSEKDSASRHAVKGDDAGEGPGRGNGANKDAKEDKNGVQNKDKAADKNAATDKVGAKGAGKDKDKDGKGKGKDGEPAQDKSGDDGTTNSDAPSVPKGLSELFHSLGPILKWIVFGIIALIVVVLVLRSGLKWLANFFAWARNLLDALRNLFSGLFGGWGSGGSAESADQATIRAAPPRPFAAYSNPFTDGSANGRSARALVRYTFAAFEAWAHEHDLGRTDGETPLEFVNRVGEEVPAVEEDARQLADLFALAAYSADELPPFAARTLRTTWESLGKTARAPV